MRKTPGLIAWKFKIRPWPYSSMVERIIFNCVVISSNLIRAAILAIFFNIVKLKTF